MAGWVPVLGYTLMPDTVREETGSSMLQVCPGPDLTFTKRAFIQGWSGRERFLL
jgi:hypothetical protein